MKIVVLAGFAESLVRFRGPLLAALVEAGHQVIACAPESSPDIAERIQKLGATYRPFPLERAGLNPFKDLGFLLRLIRFFRQEQPDILFSYTIKPVIYGSLAARCARVQSIFSMITGLGYAFMGDTFRQAALSRLVRVLYAVALRCNKVVFFQNPDDRDLFGHLGLVGGKVQSVVVNGSGVDLDFFGEAPLPVGPPTFLLIARMLKDKGVLEYVEAARLLKRRHPHIIIRMAGPLDANPTSLTAEQLEDCQKGGVVDYLASWVSDVRPLIAGASVFVLPSYREGTPMAVLEAMAMGRAIITTDVPGCRQTVRNGSNGFLVPAKDAPALAQAMERFVLDPDLPVAMGRQSRQIALEEYNVHEVNKVIIRNLGLVAG